MKIKQVLLLAILLIFLSSCATWRGIKEDSSDLWNATKNMGYKMKINTKDSINKTLSN